MVFLCSLLSGALAEDLKAGCWNHVKVGSLTCVMANGCQLGLNFLFTCPFPRGLSLWRLDWTSSQNGGGVPRASVERGTDKQTEKLRSQTTSYPLYFILPSNPKSCLDFCGWGQREFTSQWELAGFWERKWARTIVVATVPCTGGLFQLWHLDTVIAYLQMSIL